MIIDCPSCRTRFRVEEAALRRPGGRLLRCGNCRHSWRHSLETVAPLRAEPEPPSPLPAGPRPSVLAPEQREAPRLDPERSHWATIAAVLAILLLGVAALAGVLERRAIVALYPAAAGFYARIGLPVERQAAAGAAAAALKIEHIAASRTPHGLIIEGDIQNNGTMTSEVPRLRISLQDRNNRELQSEVVDAPEAQVSAGAHLHFSAPFANPDKAATDVEVTFASGAAQRGVPGTEPPPASSTAPFPRASKS